MDLPEIQVLVKAFLGKITPIPIPKGKSMPGQCICSWFPAWFLHNLSISQFCSSKMSVSLDCNCWEWVGQDCTSSPFLGSPGMKALALSSSSPLKPPKDSLNQEQLGECTINKEEGGGMVLGAVYPLCHLWSTEIISDCRMMFSRAGHACFMLSF